MFLSRNIYKMELEVWEGVSLMKQAKERTFKGWVQQLKTNPKEALPQTKRVYTRREHEDCSDAFLRCVGGGPSEAVTWPIYNAIGKEYLDWDRELKDQALEQLLGIFDGINWADVNGERGIGHTTGIREPLLLADIHIVRPVYWPGLDEGKRVIAKYDGFNELRKDIINGNGTFKKNKVNSDFVVGYSLLRSDFCKHGNAYIAAAEPAFLERTLKGIVALRFGRSDADTKTGMNRLYELLPTSVHERLDPLRREGDWADPRKFR